jgi:hypothetical protein
MSAALRPSRLTLLLLENQAARNRAASDAALAVRLTDVKAWQAARLAATYADFLRQPSYAAAVDFFLRDLYGPMDLSARDRDLLRVHGVMQRLLPATAVDALALALELEVLTQRLDFAVAKEIGAGPIDVDGYAAAYRAAGDRGGRERQIELIGATGRYLDRLVTRPGIRKLVRLTRAPAHAAGFGALQSFLERGLSAFAAMGGASSLLEAIASREHAILERLFAGIADPLRWDVPA